MIRRKASVVTQKPGRHADAFDPRKLPQVRALAADDRDLRLVDLLEDPARSSRAGGLPFGSRPATTAACFSAPIASLPSSLAASEYGALPGA